MSHVPRVIPHLSSERPLSQESQAYLEALRLSGFQGEAVQDLSRRLVGATDNSVYQLLPEAILYPRDTQDVQRALRLLGQDEHRRAQIAPRGGGTGTNGQSLTHGISLDLSRYFSEVIELNLDEKWAWVEAGVVLDQLNDQLRPSGLFFAPNLSPSNRATIGGMINTDAAGKGSRIYGKTSDHILQLKVTLVGGEEVVIRPQSGAEVRSAARRAPESFEARIALPLLELATRERETIEDVFPTLSRFMTGYNLKHLYDESRDLLDLTRLIAGSEGTLGVVTSAQIRLTELPKARRLILLRYRSFFDALGSAQLLLARNPSAIETIDENILTLARADASYHELRHLIEDGEHDPAEIKAINLVEFEGRDLAEVASLTERCVQALAPHYGSENAPIGHLIAESEQDQALMWGLRKRGVGLLAARPGKRKPIAFVEDTVVPPERLSEYIREFTALLDAEGVEYGLFGHVDVGCLHVRPALNLRDPDDEARFIRISDQVAQLVKSYGGLIWGEHGKGIRSAYSPDFFGPLYPALQEVKAIFDGHNQLNPGKVATPAGSHDALLALASPLRAHEDRKISQSTLSAFEATVNCNGNGQCFDYHPDHLMCPSARVTRDRLHSPKGRAGVMRAWLCALSEQGHELTSEELDLSKLQPARGLSRVGRSLIEPLRSIGRLWRARRRADDLSQQVYEAMHGCLSCKACASACPVRVDIPQQKARFLQVFYQRYPRPLRDYLVSSLEQLASWGSHGAWLWNGALKIGWIRSINQRWLGLVDPPMLSERSALKRLRDLGVEPVTEAQIESLSSEDRARAVIVVPDAFNTFFDAQTLIDTFQVIEALGALPLLAPFSPNGKGAHVKGRLVTFKRQARAHLRSLTPLARSGLPMVCVDPAVALTYRDEYLEAFGRDETLQVQLMQEWLITWLRSRDHATNLITQERELELFAHCTERSLAPDATQSWIEVFKQLGLTLKSRSVGCCGMCGVYGHEREHVELSKALFDLSWAPALTEARESGVEVLEGGRRSLVTGYSCRTQVKRCLPDVQPLHPLSLLAELMQKTQSKREA